MLLKPPALFSEYIMTNSSNPLILTLTLDADTATFFNTLRKQYFPPAINYIDAHLTLFHHLPPQKAFIAEDLDTWSQSQPPIVLKVTAVKSIGRGVAYKIESPQLLQLHQTMQQKWKAWLTPQDNQKRWPHITVQNKVSPEVARQTLQILQASFQPFAATGLGFSLWSYEGGPWKHLKDYFFHHRP